MEIKKGSKVAPTNIQKPGTTWEEGILEDIWAGDLYNITITKSTDKLVWATSELKDIIEVK